MSPVSLALAATLLAPYMQATRNSTGRETRNDEGPRVKKWHTGRMPQRLREGRTIQNIEHQCMLPSCSTMHNMDAKVPRVQVKAGRASDSEQRTAQT